jgi:hypothetical protein
MSQQENLERIAQLKREIAEIERKLAEDRRVLLDLGLYDVTVTFHVPVYATDEDAAVRIAARNLRDEVSNAPEFSVRPMTDEDRTAFYGCLPWDDTDMPWPQNLTIQPRAK